MAEGLVSWETADMRSAGHLLVGDGSDFAGLGQQLSAPSAEMFGTFLSNAVAMTEPAATEHNRELAAASGGATTEIGDRLLASAGDYDQVESGAEQSAGSIRQLLGQGH